MVDTRRSEGLQPEDQSRFPKLTSLTKGFGALALSPSNPAARSRCCVGIHLMQDYARHPRLPNKRQPHRGHIQPGREAQTVERDRTSPGPTTREQGVRKGPAAPRNRSRERRTTNYRINVLDACVDCGRTKRDEDHAASDPLEWMHCSMLLLNTSVQ